MNLSIFSFKNQPSKKKVIITALLLLTLASVLESILRYYKYPHPQNLNDHLKERFFPTPLEKLGNAWVIIGNSRMMNGLTPEIMHRQLEKKGVDVMVYNIAYPGTWTISFLSVLDSLKIYPRKLIMNHSSIASTIDWHYQATKLKTRLIAPNSSSHLKYQENVEFYLKYYVNKHIVLTNYKYPIWSFLLGLKAIAQGANINQILFKFGINPYFASQGIYDKYGYEGQIIKYNETYYSEGKETMYKRYLNRMKRWNLQTPKDMWSYYDQFIKVFSSKGTQLVFVILPLSKKVYNFEYVENSDIGNIQQLCLNNNIPLIDYNSSSSKSAYQSYDGGHIDYETANKISIELADYLLDPVIK